MTTTAPRVCDLDWNALRVIGVLSGRFTVAQAQTFDQHTLGTDGLAFVLRREIFTLQCRGSVSFNTPDVAPDTSCVFCGRTSCVVGRRGFGCPAADGDTFTVEVDFTDRTRNDTGFVTRTAVVSVLADTDDDATCVAAQIVSCTIPTDSMVTATRIVAVAA